MTEKEKDNIYYVCTLLEYLSRKTHNDRKTIIEYFSKQDVEHLLYVAEVNHCLSFDQVSDELIEDFQIQSGNYDAETECKHTTSSVTSVGTVATESSTGYSGCIFVLRLINNTNSPLFLSRCFVSW